MKTESKKPIRRETDKYVFFWKGYLSQWNKRDMTIDDITYNCCEQYMMAQKARLFKDEESLKIIMEADSPKTQKRQGRLVKNFDNDRWLIEAKDVVYSGNYAKFTQNKDYQKQILSTGDKMLVEANPYDPLWAIGLDMWDDRVLDESTWKGKNWLGEVLTQVREDIKKI
jgi:ribA/ribD-fused uncharacterized protein